MTTRIYDKKERHFYNDAGAGSVSLHTSPTGEQQIRMTISVRDQRIGGDFLKYLDDLVQTAKEVAKSIKE